MQAVPFKQVQVLALQLSLVLLLSRVLRPFLLCSKAKPLTTVSTYYREFHDFGMLRCSSSAEASNE